MANRDMFSRLCWILWVLSVCACSGGGSSATPIPTSTTSPPATTPASTAPQPAVSLPVDSKSFAILSMRTLDADGDQVGLDAYDLIREQVPFLEGDQVLSLHMEAVRKLVADGTIKRAVETALNMG